MYVADAVNSYRSCIWMSTPTPSVPRNWSAKKSATSKSNVQRIAQGIKELHETFHLKEVNGDGSSPAPVYPGSP